MWTGDGSGLSTASDSDCSQSMRGKNNPVLFTHSNWLTRRWRAKVLFTFSGVISKQPKKRKIASSFVLNGHFGLQLSSACVIYKNNYLPSYLLSSTSANNSWLQWIKRRAWQQKYHGAKGWLALRDVFSIYFNRQPWELYFHKASGCNWQEGEKPSRVFKSEPSWLLATKDSIQYCPSLRR